MYPSPPKANKETYKAAGLPFLGKPAALSLGKITNKKSRVPAGIRDFLAQKEGFEPYRPILLGDSGVHPGSHRLWPTLPRATITDRHSDGKIKQCGIKCGQVADLSTRRKTPFTLWAVCSVSPVRAWEYTPNVSISWLWPTSCLTSPAGKVLTTDTKVWRSS